MLSRLDADADVQQHRRHKTGKLRNPVLNFENCEIAHWHACVIAVLGSFAVRCTAVGSSGRLSPAAANLAHHALTWKLGLGGTGRVRALDGPLAHILAGYRAYGGKGGLSGAGTQPCARVAASVSEVARAAVGRISSAWANRISALVG